MGAIIGTGAQWIPWIYWKDLVRMVEFIIKNKQVGVFNAVANNTTNKEFTTTLAHAMHRKIFLPAIPSFMMRLLLGEQATLVLDGVKISNDKIRLSGFEFSCTDLKKVLEKL
jgi:NAD dependent epimerase/dehydratase family enzyme